MTNTITGWKRMTVIALAAALLLLAIPSFGHATPDDMPCANVLSNESSDPTSGYKKYYVCGVQNYLGLRKVAEYEDAYELGRLYNGEVVYHKGNREGYYWLVYSPKYDNWGYVNARYLL